MALLVSQTRGSRLTGTGEEVNRERTFNPKDVRPPANGSGDVLCDRIKEENGRKKDRPTTRDPLGPGKPTGVAVLCPGGRVKSVFGQSKGSW